MFPPKPAFQAWNPLCKATCQFWIEADFGITISTGVSRWADRSGFARDATQGTAGNQPAFNASALNGHATVDFSPAFSHYFNTGLTVANFFDAGTSKLSTICLVLKTVSGAAVNSVYGAEASAVFTSWVGCNLAYIDGFIYFDAGNGTNGPGGGRIFVTGNANAYSVFFLVRATGGSAIYKNGSVLSVGTVGTTFTGGAQAVLVGASTNAGTPGAFADMSLAMMAVWNSAFTGNEVLIASRSIGGKYGIIVA